MSVSKLPSVLLDPLIRRKANLPGLPLDGCRIHEARTVEEFEQAFRLVQVGYVYQGIEPLIGRHMRITEQHVLPEATVLVAYEGAACVGTISITLDSPAGLPLDQDYPAEMDALRSGARRIVEIGSFSVVRRCWSTGVAQLLTIAAIRVAFRWLDASHVVMSCNPDAWPMYRALWSVVPLGAEREHASLEAPTIGVVADRQTVVRNARRWFSRPMRSGLRVADHLFDGPPHPCMVGGDASSRAPMPRAVFQELFLRRTKRVAELDNHTMAYLRTRRTDDTLTLVGSTPTQMKRARRPPTSASPSRAVVLPFTRTSDKGAMRFERRRT